MYMEKAEMEQIVQLLEKSLAGNFVDKQPILLSGGRPHTFREMLIHRSTSGVINETERFKVSLIS